MEQDGTPFGRYRLLELLGRGGMGEVWRAYDIETQRVVAVKVLPPNLADDPAFVQRFRREALAAAGLNDPHVVPIHHFGEIDGRLYVDMRLINGRDLQSIIAEGPMDPARAVKIIEQVASALHDAHRIGLVHRDVKPSNILVTPNDFAYLIDFGIASAAGETRMTGTGSVIGTWAYMAPERLSSGANDPRSDTYALACVFHECLTGSQPYPGRSIEQQIGGHLGLPAPRPSALRRGLPVQLDGVIAIGMAKNPEQRYSTPTELAAAARAAITQPTTTTNTGSRGAEPAHQDSQTMALPTGAPRNYYPSAPGGVSHTDPTQYRQYGPGSDAPPPGPSRATTPPPPPEQPAGPHGPAAAPARPVQPAAKADPKRRRIILASSIAAVIVVIGLVAAFALTKSGSGGGGPTTAPLANSGPLTGTYTLAFGQSIGLNGKPEPGQDPAGNETWKLRSMCGAKGCVATGSRTSGSFKHPTNLVFDDINGRWVAVALDTERCNNHDIEEWHWIYLLPRPDGSMAGEWIDDSVECYSKRSVTFTRTGDADIAGLPDPAGLPARVASPALGLRGFYRSRVTTAAGQPKLGDQDFSVDTFCLRAGDRCLSRFVLTDFSDHQLFIYANNAWTENSEEDVPCPAGGTSHVRMTGVFPLPKPAQDPITSISGHGMEDATGSACKGGPYDQVFTRIRD
ncbi:serine/threonine-protein kinase [Mycobacterium asiaticum]|uniref:serine/threonine-protein kinase n=2 Tax=Mycobacterium asiaticum TaxID=1790 RepID=UPI000A7A9170|nr:serine/threonine-protein kinase [Mycobacterium asiaticum]